MATTDTSLTINLAGHPTLSLFSEALRGLNELVVALGRQLDVNSVEWEIEHLEAGSSIATIRGYGAPSDVLAQLTDAVLVTADVARHGDTSVLTPSVARAVLRMTSVVNGVVPELSLVSGDEAVSITSPPGDRSQQPEFITAFGALTGVIQTLSQARGLHFRIVDETYGHSVPGRFDTDLSEQMREIWGHRATVEGYITRNRRTGRPISMSNVQRVSPAKEVPPGTFLRARGVSPTHGETEPSEVVIRRLRNAS